MHMGQKNSERNTYLPMGSVELFHGYTYSGIPVAVAAALAVQDIFEKDDI